MAEGERSVDELVGGKRVVRDYGPDGKLLRIRILPAPAPGVPAAEPARSRLSFGRRKEKPAAPPQDAPAPPPPPAEPEPPAPLEATAPEPARPVHAHLAGEPGRPGTIDITLEPTPPLAPLPALAPKPEPVAEPAPAPEPIVAPAPPEPAPPAPALPIHVRFAHDPERAGTTEVVVDELRPLRPLPRLTLRPPPLLFTHEPEPAPPEPVPMTGGIFVEDPQPPEPVAAAAEPEEPLVVVAPTPPARFEVLAIEPLEPPAPELPAPEPIAVAPEPAPVEEPAPEPAPEPEPVVVPPPPPPPESYAKLVPDLETRVDALLAREDAPAKRRKRAPIPAPTFEPLAREPWEERLDAALSGSA